MKTAVIFCITLLGLSALSCTEEETAFAYKMKDILVASDSMAFTLSYDEQLPENGEPVCLRFFINSKEKFSNLFSLESSTKVQNGTVMINIENIRDNGKCPTMHLSTPADPDYKCQAQGICMIPDLKRGNYNFEIRVMDQPVALGKLMLTDTKARLDFNPDTKAELAVKEINIIPDSCIFGIFYQTGNTSDSDYEAFLNEMKKVKCSEILLPQGHYREFAVDGQGRIIFNNAESSGRSFILKTHNNYDEIYVLLNQYVNKHPEAYGFIFEDSYGRYYNVKK